MKDENDKELKVRLQRELEEAQLTFQIVKEELINSQTYLNYEQVGKEISRLLKLINELK